MITSPTSSATFLLAGGRLGAAEEEEEEEKEEGWLCLNAVGSAPVHRADVPLNGPQNKPSQWF